MITANSSRQKQILNLLLLSKSGLSIDELATQLDISRNATKQHLVTLEQAQLVQTDHLNLNVTGGRPSRNYQLTEKGIHHFPKQYAWFSLLLLTELKEELGEEGLSTYLAKLGNKLASSLLSTSDHLDTAEKLSRLLEIMQSLGYVAEQGVDVPEASIQAYNCVYHDLANEFPQLCEFDRALISTWLDKPIEQVQCMAQGDCVCIFKFK